MAASATYVPIATTNLGSASSYTFSSIPQTYTDLILIINDVANTSTNQGVYLLYNSDSGSNYSRTGLRANGSTASSFYQTNNPYLAIAASGSTNNPKPNIVQIMNYSNTTTYKTTLSRGNDAGNGIDAMVHLWRNTSAITSITIYENTATFGTNATATLYGIAAA
jgi:hypothetical protein